MKQPLALLLAFSTGLNSGPASASSRFSMAPAEGGGFVRLDTETGTMSYCTTKDSNWQCKPIAEDHSKLAEENRLLREELAKLKADLKELEHLIQPKDRNEYSESRKSLQLPSEEDVDKALTYIQRIFRKFKDKLQELEKEADNPPGPNTPL